MTVEQEPTISVAALRPKLRHLAMYGVDIDEFLRPYSVRAADLDNDTHRITFSEITGVWRRAVEFSGDAHVGLHAGMMSLSHVPRYGSGFAAAVQAAQRACSYLCGLSQRTHCFVEATDREAYVRLEACDVAEVDPGEARQAAEFLVATLYSYVRDHAHASSLETRVFLPHDPVGDISVYTDSFGSPVECGGPIAGFVLRSNDAAPILEPLCVRDDVGFATLRFPGVPETWKTRDEELIAQLVHVIRGELSSSNCDIARIAKRLALTPRTLQRRLRRHGTSYRDILGKVRAQRARELLLDPSVSILDVASALGFQDVASFHRAFKSWTGLPPGAYREARASSSLVGT